MGSYGKYNELLLPLTPLDQIAPRIYVRTGFIFKIGEGYDSETTREHLQTCFRNALLRWPFIAGQFRPAPKGQNHIELAYTFDYREMDPARRPDIFCYAS